MITVRPSGERGHFDHGWLDTSHTFSFADYWDPAHVGFGALRVINEDRVVPGKGFGTHGHRDMEIITLVLEGALKHEDSLGTGSVIRPGMVQRMSAGTGVRHSEWNASETEPVHFLQIWITPVEEGMPPGYEETMIPASERVDTLRLVASPDGAGGSLTVHQDARMHVAELKPGSRVTHELSPDRRAWIQVVRGSVRVNDVELNAGDGAGAVAEPTLTLMGGDSGAELVLFDLA